MEGNQDQTQSFQDLWSLISHGEAKPSILDLDTIQNELNDANESYFSQTGRHSQIPFEIAQQEEVDKDKEDNSANLSDDQIDSSAVNPFNGKLTVKT